MNIDSLYRADKACELGFNHTAFLIGHRVQNLGFRRNADNVNYPEHDVTRFERLTHLWEPHYCSKECQRSVSRLLRV